MLPASVKLYVGNTEFTSMLDVEADVVLEKEMNGGFKSLSFETDAYQAQQAIRLGQKVVLWDTTWSKGAFIGQVASVKMQGPCMQVACGRPTRNQRFQDTQIYREGSPLTNAVLHALGQISQVYQGTVEDSGIQLVEDSPEFALQTFEDVVQWAGTQSNSFATPLIWEVESGIGSPLPLMNMRYLDGGPRWVAKVPIDQLEQSFDIESQANRVCIAWGNREQYQHSPLSGIINYQVIPVIVDKTMDASIRVSTPGGIRDLADAYLARYFAQLIDSNGTITLDCDNELTALPPLFSAMQEVVPLWLFIPGWVVRVQPTDTQAPNPYNNMNKLAVSSSYSFKEGVLRIATGQAGGFSKAVQLLESYAVNRLYQAQVYGELRFAVPNSDELPVYGPEFTTTPPSFRNGVPTFVITATGEVLPYDGVVHPNLLKDEGLEMNLAFGATGTVPAFKPSIKSIPGVYSTYDIIVSSAAAGFQTPSTAPVIKLYKNPVNTTTLTPIQTLTLSISRTTGTLTFPVTFAQGDRLFVELTTAGTETGLLISIALHGVKSFPAINVVHT